MLFMMLLISIAVGASFILNKSFNMMLSKETGIYSSNLVNHITGLICCIIFLMFILNKISLEKMVLSDMPWYAWIGGFLGAGFVILSNYTFGKMNVLNSTVLILAGQFLSSLLVDVMILHINIDIKKILGAVLIALAIIIYCYSSNVELKKKAWKAD